MNKLFCNWVASIFVDTIDAAELKHEKMVLDSGLVSVHFDNNWKWIYYLPCLQQTTASHPNQRVCCFTRSGGCLCWDERRSVAVLL